MIIGGGAAGLTAALYLGRARRRVLVMDAGSPRNAPAAHMHGFLSRDGMAPGSFLAEGRRELRGYGVEIGEGRVDGVGRTGEDRFEVRLAEHPAVTARAVLVATGLRDELPDIAGLRERWGRDVVHCPYCHGWEVRDSPIAVLGGDNRPFSLHQAALIRQWSSDVVFFPDRIELDQGERERLAARGVRVVEGKVARVVVDEDRLRGVELADGRTIERSAVFVGPRFVPLDGLLRDLGCAVGENGWVVTDPSGRTSVDGVWAAGNVVDESAQAIRAAGAGATAGIALNHHLLARDIEHAVATR
ncbi:NAD(P)/FAD-dependent oxidoreductase [Pseudonocardia spinosispora]|uniref:NAD(P)/FAD-dependent oxidoreductase n=1 Tax=Pseudonocardia spinosispora TaxID=103441 RepID=UPI001FE12E80|nr:NAD(P)/FAD-dependent oxidoreductase [Pseudonocardia spinosispora]